MSTYRSRLEAGVHPSTDPRRSAELRGVLLHLAAALTPRWRPTGEPDDFGSALVRIGARLAEETTQRLDQTARRDALAFFDLLGLPPGDPRPATGALVMALGTRNTLPVYAPARTQVTVSAGGGEEATFETQVKLRVVPGRVAELVAVDPAADRVELAPARVTSVDPPTAVPSHYRVVSFAGTGSPTVQLSPSTGLVEGDALRFGTHVHRVLAADKNGLVSLLDPLEEPASAESTATRVSSLESFTMRNLQQHVLYVGHKELLNLEQRAKVFLDLAPARLARELSGLDVTYTMYGTPAGQDEPDWHPLDVLGTSGSELRLAKAWTGPVEETEVHGRKSRWLRAQLHGGVLGPSPTSRASSVRLTVESVEDDAASTAGSAAGSAGPAEGSRTVVHAAHNGTPLATTRRFFPFGPEPLRFDTFSMAAPEALSKTGATVTLDISMADSSLAQLAVVASTSAGPVLRAYGVGQNGNLQVLLVDAQNRLRWIETGVAADDGQPVLLGGTRPVAVERADGAGDVVVVGDRYGDLWAAVLKISPTSPVVTVDSSWHKIERPQDILGARPGSTPQAESGAGDPADVPMVAPAPPGPAGTSAVVLAVTRGVLQVLTLDQRGQATGTWTALASTSGRPALSSAGQLTAVQGSRWPTRPDRLEALALDDDGAPWVAEIAEIPATQQLTASWRRLTGQGGQSAPPPARRDVVPTATRFRPEPAPGPNPAPEHLWVCYAVAGGTDAPAGLHGIDAVGAGTTGYPVAARVAAGSALHANPEVLGVQHLPTTVGLAGEREAFVWQGGEAALSTWLPGPASSGRPLLLKADGDESTVVIAGAGERLLRATLQAPRDVEYALHDLVELESTVAPHRLEITVHPDDPSASDMVTLGTANRRIVHEDLRIYEIDRSQLPPQATIRFLRSKGPQRTGAVEAVGSSTRLRLAVDDTKDTTTTARLIIGTASYGVTAVSADRVATLEPPVVGAATGDQVSYLVGTLLAEAQVTDDLRGTLVELEATDQPAEIVFDRPARPRSQGVRRGHVGSSVWVRLDEPWAVEPASATRAAVTSPPVWTETTRDRGYSNPELSWEYNNGGGWLRLEKDFLDGTDNLSTSGKISFVVPPDLTTTAEIGGKDDYWIRARLVGGDYGRPTYVVREEKLPGDVTEQRVVVDTSDLRPPEIVAIEALFSGPGGVTPEVVLVENNVDVLDQTQAASASSASFELFQGAGADAASGERALFAGLTAQIGRGPLTLFVDAADQAGTGAVQVDLRTPDGWQRVPVDDTSASLRRTGIITLSLDHDPVVVRLFGQDRVWFRFRRGEDPPGGTGSSAADDPWAPVVRGLLPNAVQVSQAVSFGNEVLGSSLGEPGTVVHLANPPVLPISVELRVREELSDEERAGLADERRSSAGARHGAQPPAVLAGLERIPGTWVLWRRVNGLAGEDGDARVYVLDPSTGRITFGDGRNGRIPPAGRDSIRCFGYQQGGGAAGNLGAWSPTRLTTAVEGVETAAVPAGTAGGVDAPPPDSVFATGPQRLRHAGRSMTPADIEALAVAASGDVLRARCRRPDGPGEPVRITVAVRDDTSRCPRPTPAQLEAVAAHVRATGWGGLVDESVEVGGPTFVPLAVRVDLVAPPDRWADVEDAARTILVDLFHPVTGGPDRSGWPFGRLPSSADLLRAVSPVAGLDRVKAVALTRQDGTPLDALPDDGLVCAEPGAVTVVVTTEGASS